MKITLLILASLLLSSELSARTVYITDEFLAPLRTGQTNAYRIRANLKSGSALELLETNSESGYSRVKTSGGTEGWVLSRYLVNTPIARERLEQVQQQLAVLEQKNKDLITAQSQAKTSSAELSEQNQALTLANTKLEEELNYIKQVSGNAITINERNQQLIEENQNLKNKVELLTSDNDRLKDDVTNQFFMLGAGAILLGLILGLVLPSLKPKRKDTGWV